jgi:hypothetical protein
MFYFRLSVLFNSGREVPFSSKLLPFIADSINYSKNQEHPRTIKSHLPFPLLPEQIRNGLKKTQSEFLFICNIIIPNVYIF